MKFKKSMKKVFFTKMQALGNDFMIVNCITQNISFFKNIIKNLSNRYLGIGFDQLLILEKGTDSISDFNCRIFNANGNEVFQCGNGIRCLAYFLYLKKITKKINITIATKTSVMFCKIINTDKVIVNMGKPKFSPLDVPFISTDIKKYYCINVNDKNISFGIVSLGNPHCVVVVDNINDLEINVLGPLIEKHQLFPDRVNVGFMQIMSSNHIKLRVYERGVGETQACGSGACAAVSVGINQKLLNSFVQVDLFGGTLNIEWLGENSDLYMSGSATYVYDGFTYI